MDDPLIGPDRLGQRSQHLVGHVPEREWVDQHRSAAFAANLDQVGPLRVAVARGALGVDGERSGAGRQCCDGRRQLSLGRDHRRQPVPEGEERSGWPGRGHSTCVLVVRPIRRLPRQSSGVLGGRHRARWPRRLGSTTTPSGNRGQAGRRTQQVSPRLHVRGEWAERRPRCAHLELSRARLVGHAAEALRSHPRHGPAGRQEAGVVGLQRLEQPAPADRAEQRVGHHLGIDVGPGVGDAAEVAEPGVIAGGVVEEDDAPAADLLAGDVQVGAQGGGEGRYPLRRGHLLAEDLRSQASRPKLLERPLKILGRSVYFASRVHTVSLCRSARPRSTTRRAWSAALRARIGP